MAGKGKSILDMNKVVESPAGSGSDEMVKRKRGRPRKYDVSGSSLVPAGSVVSSPPVISGVASLPVMSGYASPQTSQVVWDQTPAGFTSSPSSENSSNTTWRMLASQGEWFADTAAGGFRPHVIVVYPGEDMIGKIMSLAQREMREICVLAVNGTVSDVSIRQPNTYAGVATYLGRHEILSLSGSFTISEIDGVRGHMGGFTVSLAAPDGSVFGGTLAGPLFAASMIQTVVGSFVPNAYRIHRRRLQARMVSPIQSVSGAAARSNVQASVVTDASHVQQPHFQVQNHVEANSGINGVGPSSANWNSAEEQAEQKPYQHGRT